MCKSDPNKGMLIISAPKGTTLEVGEEEKSESFLKMSSPVPGGIKVFSCKLNEGVKQLDMVKK